MESTSYSDNYYYETLRAAIRPRHDWYGICEIAFLLKMFVVPLHQLAPDVWRAPTDMEQFLDRIIEGDPTLPTVLSGKSKQERFKGIIAEYPLHAALYKLATRREPPPSLITLTANLIVATTEWQQAIDSAPEPIPNAQERLDSALQYGCRAIRLIKPSELERLATIPLSPALLHRELSAVLGPSSAPLSETTRRRFEELERFFAYALGIRQGHGKRAGGHRESSVLPPVVALPELDDDPDNELTGVGMRRFASRNVNTEQLSRLRQEGLSASEEYTAPEMAVSNEPLQPNHGDSIILAVARSRNSLMHQKRAAQLLPHRWEQLNQYDLYCLWDEIKYTCFNENTALVLILLTGRCLETIANCRVVRCRSQLPEQIAEGHLYFIYEERSWVAAVLAPEDRRKQRAEWQGYFLETQHYLEFKIHPAVWSALQTKLSDAMQRAEKSSARLFRRQVIKGLESKIKRTLQDTNKKFQTRLTLHRITNHLFNTLTHHGNDMADACLIAGKMPPFGQQAALYYYAPRIEHLRQMYTQTINSIMALAGSRVPLAYESEGSLQKAAFVGSSLCPDLSNLPRLVEDLRTRLREQRRTWVGEGAWIDFHNAYTCYCLVFLLFSTGYRSVRDPIGQATDIDWHSGFLAVADKTDDSDSHTRIVPLPPLVMKQLELYTQHCRIIKSKLAVYFELSEKTRFFFFLKPNGHPQRVTPAALALYLQWTYELPLNINRHLLRSQLRDRGVPGELVDAFMGHWEQGQEPWGRYSSLSPREFSIKLLPALNAILNDMGWTQEAGLG